MNGNKKGKDDNSNQQQQQQQQQQMKGVKEQDTSKASSQGYVGYNGYYPQAHFQMPAPTQNQREYYVARIGMFNPFGNSSSIPAMPVQMSFPNNSSSSMVSLGSFNSSSSSLADPLRTSSSLSLCSSSQLPLISGDMTMYHQSMAEAAMHLQYQQQQQQQQHQMQLHNQQLYYQQQHQSQDLTGNSLQASTDSDSSSSTKRRGFTREASAFIAALAQKYEELAMRCSNSQQMGINKTLLFAGRTVPKISLNSFLVRMGTIINYIYDADDEKDESDFDLNSSGIRCLLVCSIYLDRLLHYNNDLEVTPKNVHRLFLAAVIVAIKTTEDQIPSSQVFAGMGGVDENQVYALEWRLCVSLNFKLYVHPDTYFEYFRRITSRLGIEYDLKCDF